MTTFTNPLDMSENLQPEYLVYIAIWYHGKYLTTFAIPVGTAYVFAY